MDRLQRGPKKTVVEKLFLYFSHSKTDIHNVRVIRLDFYYSLPFVTAHKRLRPHEVSVAEWKLTIFVRQRLQVRFPPGSIKFLHFFILFPIFFQKHPLGVKKREESESGRI